MPSTLPRRILVAAVGIPLALLIVYVGGWALAGLLAVFGVLGANETYRLALRGGVRPLAVTGSLGAAAMPLATAASLGGARPGGGLWALAVAGWVMLTVGLAARRGPGERPLAAIGITLFGAAYAGGLPAFLLVLRHGGVASSAWAATWLVFLPLAVVWICDSLAMAGGAVVGGAKLAPVLSPNKTWAGAIVGSASALVVAPVYGAILLRPHGVELPWWQLMIFGLVVSAAGQMGDVAESLLKREVGVKDSGGIFPGHGGVLDRFDALYWALPLSVALLYLFEVL